MEQKVETPDPTTKVCSHCQQSIPKGANKCPKCQSDLRNWFSRHPIITGIVALFIIGSALSAVSGDEASNSVVSTKGPNVEIVDITTRVTESNAVWSKYAWNLTLKNNTDREQSVMAEIKWTDAEGFVVDTDNEFELVVPANSEKTFNDYDLIDADVAGNIVGIEAEIN